MTTVQIMYRRRNIVHLAFYWKEFRRRVVVEVINTREGSESVEVVTYWPALVSMLGTQPRTIPAFYTANKKPVKMSTTYRLIELKRFSLHSPTYTVNNIHERITLFTV